MCSQARATSGSISAVPLGARAFTEEASRAVYLRVPSVADAAVRGYRSRACHRGGMASASLDAETQVSSRETPPHESNPLRRAALPLLGCAGDRQLAAS